MTGLAGSGRHVALDPVLRVGDVEVRGGLLLGQVLDVNDRPVAGAEPLEHHSRLRARLDRTNERHLATREVEALNVDDKQGGVWLCHRGLRFPLLGLATANR